MKNGQVTKKEDLLEVADDTLTDIMNALEGLSSATSYLTQRFDNLKKVIELCEKAEKEKQNG